MENLLEFHQTGCICNVRKYSEILFILCLDTYCSVDIFEVTNFAYNVCVFFSYYPNMAYNAYIHTIFVI